MLVLNAKASNCIPAGMTDTLKSQAEVDSFHINYPGCTVVDGNLRISGNDITNLDSLIFLHKVNELSIIGTNLQYLNGLNNLDTISNLVFIETPIKSLSSLSNFKYTENITIYQNSDLENLVGLEGIQKIVNNGSGNSGWLYISNNQRLVNLKGLNNLKECYYISILGNSNLINFDGLQQLITADYLQVYDNYSLLNFYGLDNIKTINKEFIVEANRSLVSLNGLNSLEICNDVFIHSNYLLVNLNGLQSLHSVSLFSIQNNSNLENVNNINSVINIDSSLVISNNPKLGCCYKVKQIIQNNPLLTDIVITNNDIGCSSVPEVMTLTPTSTCCIAAFINDTIIICQGDTYTIASHNYTATGIYKDTIHISAGCDSIIITNLTVLPKSYQIVNKNFCAGQQFVLSNGRIITTNGTYKDTIPSFCDSIIEYHVSFVNNITVNQTATICQGKNYTLPKGTIIKIAGIYKDTLSSSFGCDSIIITNLNITLPAPIINTVSVCKGKNYTLPNGNIVSVSGTYYDTIRKLNTCDSIIITDLTVTPPTPFINTVTICKGKNYTLPHGNIVSVSGAYYDTLRALNTCDSVIITNLTVNPYLQSSQTASICLGKTYTLSGGRSVTQSGIYYDTIKNNNGCDSIIITTLTVTNPVPFNKTDSICDGQIYTLPSGKTITSAGIYSDTLRSTSTCDSVVITTLSVFPNTFSIQLNAIDSIDAGNSVELKPIYSADSATSWNWSPANSLSCTACQNPIANPTLNTTYLVKAKTQNGCEDTAQTIIFVRQVDVYIPAAFSPNNDGINDELTVFVNNPLSFHLSVFNRWNELLFETNNVTNKWNGTYKNRELSVDEYFYVLDVTTPNGKSYHKQGTITLLK